MLRSVILALALTGAAQSAYAQDASGALVIELSGLQPQGAVMVQLFDSEEAYTSGRSVSAAVALVAADTARVAFADLPPGQYAFRLFHDVNGDGQMNTNPFGIPTEPFAFSNNARGRFGPASWADAAFMLEAGDNVERISLGGAN